MGKRLDYIEHITPQFLEGTKDIYHDYFDIPPPHIFVGSIKPKTLNWSYKPLSFSVQCSGLACEKIDLEGLILKPKNVKVLQKLNILSNKYLDSCINSISNPSLEQLNEYNLYLIELLNAQSQNSYINLREAVYPVDIEYLECLTQVDIETLTTDLFVKDKFILKNNIDLLILGQNCD